MSSNIRTRRDTMIIRSLYQPVYHRDRKQGLPGAVGASRKESGEDNLTFEDYLKQSFQGEVVQKGTWFSPRVTELSRKNFQKLDEKL